MYIPTLPSEPPSENQAKTERKCVPHSGLKTGRAIGHVADTGRAWKCLFRWWKLSVMKKPRVLLNGTEILVCGVIQLER